jgi:hypothetical protein
LTTCSAPSSSAPKTTHALDDVVAPLKELAECIGENTDARTIELALVEGETPDRRPEGRRRRR